MITVVSNDKVYQNEMPLKIYAFLVATIHHSFTEEKGREVADLCLQMYFDSDADAADLFNWICYNYDSINKKNYEEDIERYENFLEGRNKALNEKL